MTPNSFEEDLQKSVRILKSCVGQEILGFRAPSFTITSKTLWALDILARNGFRYDSSVFPVRFHPDYGIPEAVLSIHQLPNCSLIEVPMSCAEVRGKKIPCSGGGYFRIFPYFATRALLRLCNRQGRPVIFYLHPWEVDPDQPRVRLPFLKRFRHYCNLKRTLSRFDRLLGDFDFTSIRSLLKL